MWSEHLPASCPTYGKPMARVLLRRQSHRGHSPITQFSKVLSIHLLSQRLQLELKPMAQIQRICSTERLSIPPATSTLHGRHRMLARGFTTSGSHHRMITAELF